MLEKECLVRDVEIRILRTLRAGDTGADQGGRLTGWRVGAARWAGGAGGKAGGRRGGWRVTARRVPGDGDGQQARDNTKKSDPVQ
jgi:hypothetical protein